ncbi:MAG: hydantoinase/oxoprolinase family protein [Planctomycetes bacterium]|nr:hydantoinase/oxoprolinase family protein [Planctomycetota bacterium]
MTRERVAVGIDVGGTFTDFITADGAVAKRPSSRGHPGRVLAEGLDQLGLGGTRGLSLAHGTTVATNALLEEDLAPVGLLITEGFRDLLALGRQNRPGLYDLEPRPACAAPDPALIAEIAERVAADGSILKALDLEAARAAAHRLMARGAESLVICFLNSYRQPAHERVLAEILRADGLAVTASAELAAEFREFERFSTAWVNAGLMPLLGRYADDLRRALDLGGRSGRRMVVMQSDGGAIGLEQAAREPVRLLLSGPAGGLVGAWAGAADRERRRLVTFDMGGTSTDVALLDGGPPVVGRAELGGRPLLVPILDIHTVGAGGGSIARLDRGGLLKVGPASAGADPGPACYGRGGPATVTDAHLVLGRIPPGLFLGGSFALDEAAARARVGELAAQLGLGLERVALGVLAVAEATMERALRRISLERGHDPRRFALVAFGGAGGLHAASLAARLEMPEVVVPRDPGLLSARGMLQAPLRKELARTVLGRALAEIEAAPARAFADLERRARAELRGEGLAAAEILVERLVDLRYPGQSYELSVPLGAAGRSGEAFHLLHAQRYGFARPEEGVELVALRLRARGPAPRVRQPRPRRVSGRPKPVESRRLVFEDGAGTCPVYRREDLGSGQELRGPAVIVEYSATTVLPPGHRLEVDRRGALVIRRAR